MLKTPPVNLRSVSPKALRHTARLLWEGLRDWVSAAALGLRFIAVRKPLPRFLIFFGFAPGDDLLCTAVLRELRNRGQDRLLMISNHAELFTGNPDPDDVRPFWRRYSPYRSTASICRHFASIWGGRACQIEYAPSIGPDRRTLPSRHIVAEMCARTGITGPVSIRPYLHLSEAEKAAASWACGRIAIQSSGMAARHPAYNKQWYSERFQQVVSALTHEHEFIQLGSPDDPQLEGALDLRGKTTIRESAAILYHARLYVGLEGFPMHLARAVDCPSVIILGGRIAPWQIGYVCNLNLHTPLPCAPCWRTNTCDFDRRCMQAISVSDVVQAIREMLGRPRNPLATEVVEIPLPEGPTRSPLRHGQRRSAYATPAGRL